MRTARLTTFAALLALTTACASESALAPKPMAVSSTPTASAQLQVPLLYVVDDVRLPVATVPDLDPSLVASVTVLKGRAALLKYGPDASYGVVIIRTKKAIAQTD